MKFVVTFDKGLFVGVLMVLFTEDCTQSFAGGTEKLDELENALMFMPAPVKRCQAINFYNSIC